VNNVEGVHEYPSLEEIQKALGVDLRDPSLLELALTHASFSEDHSRSNERLEFLGDAILAAVICEALYRLYPNMLEGDLTRIKSAVVSRRTCAAVARKMGLDKYVRLGKGITCQSDVPRSVLSDALESLIAAVFLDGGYAAARRFVLKHFRSVIEQAASAQQDQNFKSLLQHYAQKYLSQQPHYVVLDEQGPDHAKSFLIAVRLGERQFTPQWGRTKKEAEQKAAKEALIALGELPPEYKEETGSFQA